MWRIICISAIIMTISFGINHSIIAQDPADSAFMRRMLIEKTLMEARGHLEQSDYNRAVATLEKNLGIIKGDKPYLETLRLAYSGLVRELESKGESFDLATYQRRLAFLDPTTARSGQKTQPLPTQEPAKPAKNSTAELPVVNVGVITPVAVTTVTQSGLTARGKIEDAPNALQNPFSWNNSEQKYQGRAQRQSAEASFSRKDYKAAAAAFAKAWQEDPSLDRAAQERWAYSRLHTISQSGITGMPAAEALKELQSIATMAPRLKPQTDELKIILSRTNIVESAPTHQETNGWTTTATPSFRVHHHLERTVGEALARQLESTRTAQIEKWFGTAAEPWNPPCEVVIYATAAQYATATGVPATSPGHSTVKVEGGRIVLRRIDLHADDPNMSIGVLPHEATHTVLAGRFGNHMVPRWADEGMAVLAEPSDRIDRHISDLPRLSGQTGLFPIRTLMMQQEYPEPRLMGTFYAQSVSVVQYMTALRGPRVFAAFLADGLNHSYDQSLSKHYQTSWEQLESGWRSQGSTAKISVTASR